MVYLLFIVGVIILFIAKKNREKSTTDVYKEIEKKQIVEIERKNEEKMYVISKILKDRICKYKKNIYFVLSKNELLKLEWSENGETLYHNKIGNFDYQDIEFEEDIKKSSKDYLMLNDVRFLLIDLYDIIIPDVEKLNENISKAQKSINIAKNLEDGQQYIKLMEKYLKTMETLLQKAIELDTKYNSFIKEIFAQYEIEKFENTMNVSIIDRNIDYKNIEENLLSQYKEYSNYRKIYEDLSKELKETL
jgi:hypothetical protein